MTATAGSRNAVRRGIVTPEAVVLEFETAGLPSRLGAAFLDTLIQGALFVLILLAAFGLGRLGVDFGGFGPALLYVLVFLLLFGYPAAFETLWRGRTPGKAAMGLRVVTIEGAPVRFRHAAIRAILLLVDLYVFFGGLVGVILILVTSRNQRLGDLVAGTIVLRERSGAKAPTAVRFAVPRGTEELVAALDVSRLEHEDYGVVRSFLLRAPSLAAAARYQLASSLSATIAERLRTAPPPGMPAEVFLTCVAAAHQARHAPAVSAPPAFTSVWAEPPAAASGGGVSGFARPAPPSAPAGGFEAPG